MDKNILFEKIENFFLSLAKSLNYSYILLLTVGLFLVSLVAVFILCANSYENKLLKTINKFNNYFQTNPKIDESNLVSFNNKMRSEGVPKLLRKQWQAYVLYQEHKASEYMSYDNCVKEPMKNSTYSREVKALNYIAIILASLSLVLNCFCSFDMSTGKLFSTVLVTPVLIAIIDCLATIFLNARHTSIIADLANNYQYFEANMDKATETIPSYVDYEILFDKNEIKSGIPILYAYLQNRAEMEQKELELARLKNLEHDRFNFDELGDNAALVLDRAMQESENYIAERKKFAQDIEQINSEMAQEDIQYREYTKDYNRQMQVSKETFANFKQQLEDSTSTIQSNYLKKQQQQELDRQRNLERDFDVATEKHKKIMDGFRADLDGVEEDRDNSKKALEDAMKAEFSSYKSKVYNAARESLKNEENEQLSKAEARIVALEEELSKKNEILKKYVPDYSPEDNGNGDNSFGGDDVSKGNYSVNQKVEDTNHISDTVSSDNSGYTFNYLPTEEDLMLEKKRDLEKLRESEQASKATEYFKEVEKGEESTAGSTIEDESDNSTQRSAIPVVGARRGRPKKVNAAALKPGHGKRGRPKKATTVSVKVSTGKRGRPSKQASVETKISLGKRGRPRKTEAKPTAPSTAKRGRPRKVETTQAKVITRKRGRPRKNTQVNGQTIVKQSNSSTPIKTNKPKGRPSGAKGGAGAFGSDNDDFDAFLKEIDDAIKLENDKIKAAGKAIENKSDFDEKPKN